MTYKMGLLAQIKSILPNWIVKIEFCHRCGVKQPLVWYCDDDNLWKEINGSANGVLCPKCFWDLAHQRNLFIIFYARLSYVRDEAGEWQEAPPNTASTGQVTPAPSNHFADASKMVPSK